MYEEMHPIPQQISAYQFRLVGDMTLKQFFQVAGGALVALLVYSSSLPSFIKWPLVIFFFLFGIALAFFPLEDRPLSKWIFLFFKAIYSPTIYYWQRSEGKLNVFQPEAHEVQLPTLLSTPTPVQKIPEIERLEKKENEFLSKISSLFKQITKIRSRPILSEKEESSLQENLLRKGTTPVIPEQKFIRVEKKGEEEKETFRETPSVPSIDLKPMIGKKPSLESTAKFSLEASPPTPPTKPNVVVGQVIDTDGKIVEGAIIEIRDSEGRPVRALKSNKLGHFMIVTPLINGRYEIITEKEGLTFEPLVFEAKGQIIPPIAILAKKKPA